MVVRFYYKFIKSLIITGVVQLAHLILISERIGEIILKTKIIRNYG